MHKSILDRWKIPLETMNLLSYSNDFVSYQFFSCSFSFNFDALLSWVTWISSRRNNDFFEKMTTFSTFSNELSHVTQPKTVSKLKENHHFSQYPTNDFYFFRPYEKAWCIPLLSQFDNLNERIFLLLFLLEKGLFKHSFYSNCGNVTTISITSLKYCICEHFWHLFILELHKFFWNKI